MNHCNTNRLMNFWKSYSQQFTDISPKMFITQHFSINWWLYFFNAKTFLRPFIKKMLVHINQIEVSSHDQTNLTKKRLEYDRKIFTTTNENIGTWPKNLHQRTLTIEHDQIYIKYGWIFYFESCSTVNVCRCEILFTKFWSYSFGHVDSVMWVFLIKFSITNFCCKSNFCGVNYLNKLEKNLQLQNKEIFEQIF